MLLFLANIVKGKRRKIKFTCFFIPNRILYSQKVVKKHSIMLIFEAKSTNNPYEV